MTPIKLLLIEDDQQMADLLSRFLEEQSMEVMHVTRPSQSMTILEVEKFDLIILDLSLPEMDGLDLCREIRKLTDIHIIISSARSDLDDKLIGFENGADDYLPKPYSPKELLARIKSLLRRQEKNSDEISCQKRFKLHEEQTQIHLDNSPLSLTLAEYEILKLLMKRYGQTVSREEIANSIDAHRFDSGIESINILIGRIRKKLDPNKYDTFIQTVRGIGYRFVEN
jgi:two-component system OmpR family response regulator